MWIRSRSPRAAASASRSRSEPGSSLSDLLSAPHAKVTATSRFGHVRWPILLLTSSAVAALVGTFVGGINVDRHILAGPAAFRRGNSAGARQKGREAGARTKLFILDASKLYLDALEHDTTEVASWWMLHATLNRMRCCRRPRVIAAADNALRMIIDTYRQGEHDILGDQAGDRPGLSDPLRAFSEACHEELMMY